jgi:hypothetical protein
MDKQKFLSTLDAYRESIVNTPDDDLPHTLFEVEYEGVSKPMVINGLPDEMWQGEKTTFSVIYDGPPK